MGHTYTDILVHVVFSTKERRPIIVDSFRERLYEYMAGIANNEFGRAIQIGGVADHVHGLLQVKTDVSVADAMRKWKSLSSKWVNETLKLRTKFGWQEGYSAFSVSRSQAPRVQKYIVDQVEHHRKLSFQEEVLALLEKHGIAFDPKYLWD